MNGEINREGKAATPEDGINAAPNAAARKGTIRRKREAECVGDKCNHRCSEKRKELITEEAAGTISENEMTKGPK